MVVSCEECTSLGTGCAWVCAHGHGAGPGIKDAQVFGLLMVGYLVGSASVRQIVLIDRLSRAGNQVPGKGCPALRTGSICGQRSCCCQARMRHISAAAASCPSESLLDSSQGLGCCQARLQDAGAEAASCYSAAWCSEATSTWGAALMLPAEVCNNLAPAGAQDTGGDRLAGARQELDRAVAVHHAGCARERAQVQRGQGELACLASGRKYYSLYTQKQVFLASDHLELFQSSPSDCPP